MVTSCFSEDNPVLDPTTKAVISYSGNHTLAPSDVSVDWKDAQPVHCIDLDDSLLVPALPKLPPGATKMWRLDYSFGIGAYQLDRAKFNGTTWSPLANTTTLIKAVDGLKGETAAGAASTNTSSTWAVEGPVGSFGSDQFVVGVSSGGDKEVDVVDILLYSLDEGSHPFHLHGHNFVRPPLAFSPSFFTFPLFLYFKHARLLLALTAHKQQTVDLTERRRILQLDQLPRQHLPGGVARQRPRTRPRHLHPAAVFVDADPFRGRQPRAVGLPLPHRVAHGGWSNDAVYEPRRCAQDGGGSGGCEGVV